MKKFDFKLEKILEYRNYEKKEAEGELAKALAVENEINIQLQSIAKKMIDLKKNMSTSFNFDDVMSESRHTNLLNFQKEELLKQLAQAQIVTEQKRNVLRECIKKTTALEKLREKQLEDWKAAVDYEESELLDDVTNKMGLA